jgi:hypothetical protein
VTGNAAALPTSPMNSRRLKVPPTILKTSIVAGRNDLAEGAVTELLDVRFGSKAKADMGVGLSDVRFTPNSGHRVAALECPLCANSGHKQNKLSIY